MPNVANLIDNGKARKNLGISNVVSPQKATAEIKPSTSLKGNVNMNA